MAALASQVAPAQQTRGFSLIEMIQAAAILLMVAGAAATVVIRTGSITRATQERYALEAAVDADVAVIQQLNDRYTCANVTATCAVASGQVDRNGFFPLRTGVDADRNNLDDGTQAFELKCLSPSTLVNPLVAVINALPNPNGLTRSAAVDTVPSSGTALAYHRYTVTYTATASGEMMRQLTLTPTTVAWCPRV
jgi:prepilin-type N-terminal cleavage/methylation domain-containing protein